MSDSAAKTPPQLGGQIAMSNLPSLPEQNLRETSGQQRKLKVALGVRKISPGNRKNLFQSPSRCLTNGKLNTVIASDASQNLRTVKSGLYRHWRKSKIERLVGCTNSNHRNCSKSSSFSIYQKSGFNGRTDNYS